MTNPLRELIAKATPGPWYLLEQPWISSDMNTMILAGSNDPHCATPVCDFECQAEGVEEHRAWEDAELIAYLRNHAEAIADLIDAAQYFIDMLDEHEAAFGDKLFPKSSDKLRAALAKITEGK